MSPPFSQQIQTRAPLGDSGLDVLSQNRPTRSSTAMYEKTEQISMSNPLMMQFAPVGGNSTYIIHADGETTATSASSGNLSNQDVENLVHGPAATSRADYEIYLSHLLTKKRGYPLWDPAPGLQLPDEYRREGISIGDVGIFTSSGGFDFLFNIFHPADHPINRGRVSQEFSPLPLEELVNDIQKTVVYGPNTYLASTSVRKSRTCVGETSTKFESTGKEVAILVMPHGAMTQNLLNTWGVRDIITKKAKDWYIHVKVKRGRLVKNGDIRVVAGIDKVSHWGIATSAPNSGHTSSYEFRHDRSNDTYDWDCSDGNGRVGPEVLIEDGVFCRNQGVFVRTINFTLSRRMWQDVLSEAVIQQASPLGLLHHIPSVNFDPASRSNHPSAALHKWLHEKHPDADVIISEDDDWISVLNGDDVVAPEPEDLCARILEVEQRLNNVIQLWGLKDDHHPRGREGEDMEVQDRGTYKNKVSFPSQNDQEKDSKDLEIDDLQTPSRQFSGLHLQEMSQPNVEAGSEYQIPSGLPHDLVKEFMQTSPLMQLFIRSKALSEKIPGSEGSTGTQSTIAERQGRRQQRKPKPY